MVEAMKPWLERGAKLLERVESAILSAALLTVAGLTVANVFARNLFGEAIAAAQEINEFLVVVICFVGIGHAVGHGRHIRMTAVYDQMPPRVRKGIMVLICAGCVVLLLVLARYAFRYANSVDRASPVLGVPMRSIYLVAPIGLLLAALQYVFVLLANVTREGVWVAPSRRDGPLEGEGGA
jgi:TRAP-type C4-dicarboxylate transport system permease small subunit